MLRLESVCRSVRARRARIAHKGAERCRTDSAARRAAEIAPRSTASPQWPSAARGAAAARRRTSRPRRRRAPAAALEVLPTDDPATAAWKQEIAEITKGTHPTLVAELEKHEAALAQSNESARRIHARQRSIIEKLYECDAKQAEDEFTAQLEFAKARIIDSLEKKAAKGSSNPGAFGRSRPNGAANGAAGGSGEPAEKRPRRRRAASACSPRRRPRCSPPT